MERPKDYWVIHLKVVRLNGVSVELTDLIKRSAKQKRVWDVLEYEALVIESEEELRPVSLSIDIED